MHSINEFEANIPAFLTKLWNMVEEPSLDDLIAWSPNGQSFVIKDQSKFARELLPMYYKHNNMASFIRQLNMYGFHKLMSVESGCAKLDDDVTEFYHPNFLKDQPNLLPNIKRKINSKVPSVSTAASAASQTDKLNQVLHEVRRMKSRQDSVDSSFTRLKIENEALWREVAMLRQKHMKQQQIVNKLIQFLVSFVQHPHTNGITVKRRTIPLMLQDHSAHSKAMNENNQSGISEITRSPTGPVIHEIDPNDYASVLLNNVQVDGCSQSPDGSNTTVLTEHCINPEPAIDTDEALDCADSDPEPSGESDDALGDNVELLELLEDGGVTGAGAGVGGGAGAEGKISNAEIAETKRVLAGADDRKRQRRPRKAALTRRVAYKNADITGLLNQDFPLIIPGTDQTLASLTAENPSPASDISRTSTVNIEALSSQQVDDPASIVDSSIVNSLIENADPIVTSPFSEFSDPVSVLSTAFIDTPSSSDSTSNTVLPADIINIPNVSEAPVIIPQKVIRPSQAGKKRQASFPKPTLAGAKKSKTSAQTKRFSRTANKSKAEAAASSQSPTVPPHSSTAAIKPKASEENSDRTVACMSLPNAQQTKFGRIQDFSNTYYKTKDIDNHVDNLQSDLESLKELLKGESISLDANTLLGKLSSDTLGTHKNEELDLESTTELLFNSEDPFSLTLDLPTTQEKAKESENKIVSYTTPPNPDLGDLFDYNDWMLPSPNGNLSDDDLSCIPELNTPDVLMTPEPQLVPSGKKKRK